MTYHTTPGRPRIAFFGMGGRLSAVPLRALLDAGMSVSLFVTPSLRDAGLPDSVRPNPLPRKAQPRSLPMLAPVRMNARQIAETNDIPVLAVRSIRDESFIAALSKAALDIICVSCFPWRLPEVVINAARLAAVNIHPSLLPDNRGPDPLFWTFRRGDDRTGVTIHRMTSAFDAGPILAQTTISVKDGVSEAALEDELATQAALGLPKVIEASAGGSLHEREQDEQRATYFPQPAFEDYDLDVMRSARWNYNFVCGLRERNVPIELEVEGGVYRVLSAISHAGDISMAEAATFDDSVLYVRCTPGVLSVRAVRVE